MDVPFLAFVLWAAALEACRPREGTGVLVLLALAGLLRPEAWLLSAVVVLYCATGADRRQVLRWAAWAALAPVTWLALDLLLTGDPLYSLHATRDLGGLLNAPTGTGRALSELPRFLRFLLPCP